MRPPDPPASTAGPRSPRSGTVAAVRELLGDFRGYCMGHALPRELGEKRDRIAAGFLSAVDLSAIYAAQSDFRRMAAGVHPETKEDLAAIAELLLNAVELGPRPERPFGDKEEDAGALLVEAAQARRERLERLPPRLSVGELLGRDFPPPTWLVPDLLTVGVTLLVGAPKLGKSWLALALGVAVGSGGAVLGRYRVQKRGSLYLALEDVPRRLKSRLERIGAPAASNLNLFTEWRAGAEGLADLDAYLYEHEPKLVLVDTLARFRGPPASDDRYMADYSAVASIKTLADRHECGIVLVHHVRKAFSEDVMDLVSGSNGLNAAADSTWILTRMRGEADAKLFITGRDTEEQTLALRFDADIGTWLALGDAAEYQQSRERREALEAVPLAPAARKTKDIVARLEKKAPAVSRLLEKLEAEGLVFSPSYGEWSRRPVNPVKVNPSQEERKKEIQETFTELPDLPPSRPPGPRPGRSGAGWPAVAPEPEGARDDSIF